MVASSGCGEAGQPAPDRNTTPPLPIGDEPRPASAAGQPPPAPPSIPREAQAAYRALHAMLVEQRSDDGVRELLQLAQPAYLGVSYAFFRNVMEFVFEGTESRAVIRRHLDDLAATRPILETMDLDLMAGFIIEQIGPTRPRLGQTAVRSISAGALLHDALATAIAVGSGAGLDMTDFAWYLRGAPARYTLGMD